MKKNYFLAFFLVMTSCDYIYDKTRLTGDDYRLFWETPLKKLAQAVSKEDTNRISKLLKEDKVDINLKEPKFGQTLLILTINNRDFNSCKKLLELGANPHIQNDYSGTSAIIEASKNTIEKDLSIKFLKLLLEYGANPSDIEKGERKEGNTTRKTPLINACGLTLNDESPLEKVKLLVESGADINYKNEYNQFALQNTLIFEHYDVAIYLLKKGANYNEIIFDRSKFSTDGKKIYITDLLRERLLPLNSLKYKQKMEIVDFLSQKGIDYRKTPIPSYVIKEVKVLYPDSWEAYLEKY